jgi:cytochrome c oxidase subunit II
MAAETPTAVAASDGIVPTNATASVHGASVPSRPKRAKLNTTSYLTAIFDLSDVGDGVGTGNRLPAPDVFIFKRALRLPAHPCRNPGGPFMTIFQRRTVLAVASLAVAGATLSAVAGRSQGQVREFSVDGRDYAFSPARIEVQKDDLVKITFRAGDIPHSFTIDRYRISKRAGAQQSVVFEFRADQAGTFPFYCELTQDSKCREMKGELVVR